MSSNEEEIKNILYQLADTVIEIEEYSEEDLRRKNVFEASQRFVEDLFRQMKEKLEICKNENEKVFVKEVTLNFLITSIKKIFVDFDCPDENIEWLADHMRDQILATTRENYEKTMKERGESKCTLT